MFAGSRRYRAAHPFFGADEFVERHYLPKRSRSQKSILVFLAQDAEKVLAPSARAVMQNGVPVESRREGGYVVWAR